MKHLKFVKQLQNIILSGEKTKTWRINDEKSLVKGDKLSFLKTENKLEFAQAIIMDIKITYFGKLTYEDFEGHEKFNSDKEMYETYSKYYSTKVDKNTKLKIITFKLI